MNELPPISFFAYLIITVLGCAAAAILAQVVIDKHKQNHWARLALAALLSLLAVGLYFAMLGGHVWLTRLIVPATPTPTPGPTVSIPTSEATHTRESRPVVPKENSEEVFVREHIAPPNKQIRKAGQWAVLITEPGSQENYPRLATAAASVIAESGHSMVAIFRPSATHGAGFDALFAADPALSRRLNEYCDQILLGKVKSSIQKNPSYPGLHSLTMTIDVKIISTSSGDVQQIQATVVGAGYEIGEARSNAEERLASNLRSELQSALK